jgi:hypothetical protein
MIWKSRVLALFLLLAFWSRDTIVAQWISMNGPHANQVTSLFAKGQDIYVCTDSGLFRQGYDDTNWIRLSNEPMARSIHSMVELNGKLIVGSMGIGVSTDWGITWKQVNWNVSGSNMILHAGVLLLADGGGIRRSTDEGVTWIQHNSGITGVSKSMSSLTVAEDRLYALASTNGVVYRSLDSGNTWSQMGSLPEATNLFYANKRLYAGLYLGGIRVSPNNGESWLNSDSGLPPTRVRIASFASYGTAVFAASRERGIFVSTNDGTSWTAINEGLTDSLNCSIMISGTDVFAGTLYGGVFRRPLSELITSVQSGLAIKGDIELGMNYPNPVLSRTFIRYTLNKSGPVTLSVYDAMGKFVRKIVDETKSAGTYHASFECSDLPAGIYMYRLSAGAVHAERMFCKLH